MAPWLAAANTVLDQQWPGLLQLGCSGMFLLQSGQPDRASTSSDAGGRKELPLWLNSKTSGYSAGEAARQINHAGSGKRARTKLANPVNRPRRLTTKQCNEIAQKGGPNARWGKKVRLVNELGSLWTYFDSSTTSIAFRLA